MSRKVMELTVVSYSKESYETQSQKRCKAKFQRNFHEEDRGTREILMKIWKKMNLTMKLICSTGKKKNFK